MSTTLPHGIIQINEGNIAWYGDITANWQLIDSKIGIYDAAIATIPAPANNGTLTINYGGTTLAMFGADDAGNVSANIPAPGDGALTIQLNGVNVQTFTANASTNATANIQCVDLTSAQTIGGNKEFTGTTTAHDVVPSATDTYDFGSSTAQWNNAYIKSLTINGVAAGDILTHNASEFASVNSLAAVATSGSYNDLSNKPTIPTVNNATLTIQKNGTTVKTFTANASSNVTANITVPTKTSDLTNDSGFITSALPIGSYIQFAGSQAPAGFLVCNGGAISRITYSALFAVIGTTYGSGDGSTTFNLPNLTDRFLQGSTTSGTVKNAGLPNITGETCDFRWPVAIGDGNGAFYSHGGGYVTALATSGDGNTSVVVFDASRSNSIYGNSTTVQPPALTCLICIKY